MSIVFQSGFGCTPAPGNPCALTVVATAKDPDGDPLTYTWSGCATGSGPEAVCVASGSGQVTASVSVNDGFGHTVSATTSATLGTQGPVLQLSPWGRAGSELVAYGRIVDPTEGDICGGMGTGPSQILPCRYYYSASVTGDCKSYLAFHCPCGTGVEAYIVPSALSGTCVVTVNLKNNAGAIGTSVFTVPYNLLAR